MLYHFHPKFTHLSQFLIITRRHPAVSFVRRRTWVPSLTCQVDPSSGLFTRYTSDHCRARASSQPPVRRQNANDAAHTGAPIIGHLKLLHPHAFSIIFQYLDGIGEIEPGP